MRSNTTPTDSADLDVARPSPRRDEEDGTTGITWSLSGTDAGDFLTSRQLLRSPNTRSGHSSYSEPPDFEEPDDAFTSPSRPTEGDNVYDIVNRERRLQTLPRTGTTGFHGRRHRHRRERAAGHRRGLGHMCPELRGDRVRLHGDRGPTSTPSPQRTMTTWTPFAWSLLGTDAARLEIGDHVGHPDLRAGQTV